MNTGFQQLLTDCANLFEQAANDYRNGDERWKDSYADAQARAEYTKLVLDDLTRRLLI